VRADAIDRIADDCERVNGAVPGGGAGGGSAAGGAQLAVVGSRRIADVLRHGLRVRVPTAGRVLVTARAGRTLAAKGRGRGTVRLRVTKAGRKRLRHARRVTLVLAAGTARARVTLTRR
jgi:hypothetical protein